MLLVPREFLLWVMRIIRWKRGFCTVLWNGWGPYFISIFSFVRVSIPSFVNLLVHTLFSGVVDSMLLRGNPVENLLIFLAIMDHGGFSLFICLTFWSDVQKVRVCNYRCKATRFLQTERKLKSGLFQRFFFLLTVFF